MAVSKLHRAIQRFRDLERELNQPKPNMDFCMDKWESAIADLKEFHKELVPKALAAGMEEMVRALNERNNADPES